MECTSAACERTAIVRVKRKATDSVADTLMVEGLPRPQSKRAASASLVQRLQQLSCSAAADPAAEPTPQRFQLLGTLPSGLHETLAARTLQALMASRPLSAERAVGAAQPPLAGPGREAPTLESGARCGASALMLYDVATPPQQRVSQEAPDTMQQTHTAESEGDSSVYDYYRAVEPGASDPPGATSNEGVPVVQVLTPEGELAYMEEESVGGSEDSNAENHYTHEYPDHDEGWGSGSDIDASPSSTSDVYDDEFG